MKNVQESKMNYENLLSTGRKIVKLIVMLNKEVRF